MFPEVPFENEEIVVKWSLFSFFTNRALRFFQKKRVQPVKNAVMPNDLTTYIRALFHDFRGPLNNISLSVDSLMVHNPPDTHCYDELLCIRNACNVLSDSLDGFIGISTMKPINFNTLELNLEPFNIVGLIKKVEYILLFDIRNKNIHINRNISLLQEWVIGDYKLLQMVLVKLVSNAIKHAEPNTTIFIRMNCLKKITHNKHHIRVTIVDKNNHIKSESFDKPDSGLYMCKKIIEFHGGTLSHHCCNVNSREDVFDLYQRRLESERNAPQRVAPFKGVKNQKMLQCVGNVFQIDLKLNICPSNENVLNKIISSKKIRPPDIDIPTNLSCKSSQPLKNSLRNIIMSNHPIKKKSGSNGSVSNMRSVDKNLTNVLVIDDSEISRKLLSRLIGSVCKDTKIHTAIDGLDALVKFIGFSETDVNVHMVLVDNVMPNLTGELLCKVLRGIGYNGLIFGITGNGVKEDREKFQENGADYVFIKPFTKKSLDSILDLVIREGYVSRAGYKLKEITQGTLTWVEDSYASRT